MPFLTVSVQAGSVEVTSCRVMVSVRRGQEDARVIHVQRSCGPYCSGHVQRRWRNVQCLETNKLTFETPYSLKLQRQKFTQTKKHGPVRLGELRKEVNTCRKCMRYSHPGVDRI